jgi:phosphate transport system substrate-binding protein
MTQEVKALRISVDGGEPIEPDPAHAYSGEYPLARYLYVYINRDPARALDPIREQFIRLIFSRDGQEEVIKDGYVPISASDARDQLAELGLHAGF